MDASLGMKVARLLDGLDQRDGAGGQLAHGADHFRVAGMADQHDLAAAPVMDLGLAMDLGDQRAGGVEGEEIARLASSGTDFGTPWAENTTGAPVSGISSSSSTKIAPFGLQAVDHIAVVDDLVADIDRRAVQRQRPLDDLDGPDHAGAEPARRAQQDFEFRLGDSGLGGVHDGHYLVHLAKWACPRLPVKRDPEPTVAPICDAAEPGRASKPGNSKFIELLEQVTAAMPVSLRAGDAQRKPIAHSPPPCLYRGQFPSFR